MSGTCNRCALAKPKIKVVGGEIHSPFPIDHPTVMGVAEAPGWEENKWGRPLIGRSGEEARHHCDINGISARGIWLDNLCHCQPPDNRTPTKDEIRACTEAHLIPTILNLQPEFIIAMGGPAIQFFLGSDANVEMTHGIPRPCSVAGHDFILIPTYHPAAGLHSPETMILFHTDMQIAGDVIRGKLSPHPPVDQYAGKENYTEITDQDQFPLTIEGTLLSQPHLPFAKPVIAIDTEWARSKPWCLSISVVPGEAFVIMADQESSLAALQQLVGYGQCITIIHNALYDLPVLAEMGIIPSGPLDTMVMAYLLQNEPQGLKPLAFRHCGMEMESYSEMVAPATYRLALEYLQTAFTLNYPDPEPVLEYKKGEPSVRQPQNIKRKIARAIKDVEEKDADPFKRWKSIKDGKDVVEDVLGPMREGELCDIDRRKAIYYSSRDADATIRVFPTLWSRINSLGLDDTLRRDMRAMPMVVDMMATGMPADRMSFQVVGDYFQKQMDRIQQIIQAQVGHYFPGGHYINPNSSQQMSTLIYDRLKLHERGGMHKAKKGGNKSTADDILKRYIPLHPVIQNIIDWRAYAKLKNSYADTIPGKIDDDGRVRTTLRMTRVITGRLASSNPNLMAQPTRSKEGKMVRDCYIAPDSRVLVSGDYSQVEMRVAASEAQDMTMVGIMLAGGDIHSFTASEMFGLPQGELDSMQHRYPAKRVGFGILNLITAEGLHRELIAGGSTIHSLDDCRRMIPNWFRIYSDIERYMKANGEHAKRFGYVKDMWGRIRYIPGIKSQNRWARIEAERQAGNAPIQMGAQGIIKEAMGQLSLIYPDLPGNVKPLIQIHDDIVWEMDEWSVDENLPVIGKVMRNAAGNKLMVPLEVDFKVGQRWGSMKKWKGGE